MSSLNRLFFAALIALSMGLAAWLVIVYTQANAAGSTPERPATAVAQVEATATPLPIVNTAAPVVITVLATVITTPTPEPTEAVQPSPTPTAVPTETAVPPVPTATAVAQPEWLAYLNYFRSLAGLPDLLENHSYSFGDANHSRYMANTSRLTHFERNDVEWFSSEGDLAAKKGNLAASEVASSPDQWAIEYWISTPFHLIPIIDPELTEVGFGVYRGSDNNYNMTATLDVLQGIRSGSATVQYPLLFPRDGGETWVIRHSLFEYPGPKASCPGYPAYPEAVGAPIVVQIGPGDQKPRVSFHSLSVEGVELAHCIFDETNYVNADETQQRIGRTILDERDAIVILPRKPFEVNKTYTVKLVVNGQTIEWRFMAVNKPK